MLARIPRQLTTYLSSISIVVQSPRCVTNAHKRITNGSQHPAEGLYILEFQNVQHMIQLKHMVATLTQLFAQKSAVHKSSGRKFPCFCAQRFAARLCVKIGTRQRYVSEKLSFTHPFKPNVLADLWVRSGEFMVFLTKTYGSGKMQFSMI